MITEQIIHDHFMKLSSAIGGIKATETDGKPINLPKAYTQVIQEMKDAHKAGNKVIFVGNGGSAAIASHMAIDYTKNGGIRAIAFNDASLLTCLGNDYSYSQVFDAALDCYADTADILVAISSSGKSENILGAVRKAREIGMGIITLSGFEEGNSLRACGDLNFYVPTKKGEYGVAEITHLAILHTILDIICEGK